MISILDGFSQVFHLLRLAGKQRFEARVVEKIWKKTNFIKK